MKKTLVLVGSIRRNNQFLMTISFSQIFPFFFHKYFNILKVVSIKPAYTGNLHTKWCHIVSVAFLPSTAWRHNVEYVFLIFNAMTSFRWILCQSSLFGQPLRDMTISQLAISQSKSFKYIIIKHIIKYIAGQNIILSFRVLRILINTS
jgi:hypothetical protein